MKDKKHEIETVIVDNVIIGFRARREVLFGIAYDIENSWYVTRSIVTPDWTGGFANRKEAREHLQLIADGNINKKVG